MRRGPLREISKGNPRKCRSSCLAVRASQSGALIRCVTGEWGVSTRQRQRPGRNHGKNERGLPYLPLHLGSHTRSQVAHVGTLLVGAQP